MIASWTSAEFVLIPQPSLQLRFRFHHHNSKQTQKISRIVILRLLYHGFVLFLLLKVLESAFMSYHIHISTEWCYWKCLPLFIKQLVFTSLIFNFGFFIFFIFFIFLIDKKQLYWKVLKSAGFNFRLFIKCLNSKPALKSYKLYPSTLIPFCHDLCRYCVF